MANITIVNGVYKPTYNWGAPSCRDIMKENAGFLWWFNGILMEF